MSCSVSTIGGVAACAGVFYLLRYLWQRSALKNASIKGQVVLITGASSGLGEACAHAFHRAGAKVILAARRVKELERVAKEITEMNYPGATGDPKILALDLEDIASIPRVAEEALSVYGYIDVLLNNGGMSFRGELMETAVQVDIRVMTVNYFGQVALTKAILPSMVSRRSGHIVGVSSIQGKIAIPYRSPYSASKYAFQAFLDTLRAEVARHNISVSTICPSYIQTGLSRNAVTADGTAYGVQDATTESGMKPEYVADKILQAVLLRQSELVLAPIYIKIATLIRALWPSLFFTLMTSRAQKQRKTMEKKK